MNDHSDILITLALAEDIGTGDVSSLYFVPKDRCVRAFVAVRQAGVVSGVGLAARVFSQVDPELEVEILVQDGSPASEGALLIRVEGKACSILTAERTALNFLQRLSGVATLTAHYVDLVKGTRARILDTRKTTPGYRQLEKRAVVHGGGLNHRMGLYDRAMVKDNHLVAEGATVAIESTQQAAESAAHSLAEKDLTVVQLQTDLAAAGDQVAAWQTALKERDERIGKLNADLAATRKRLDEAIARIKAAGSAP